MEKENSSEEEPVGFPAPKKVTKVDHNISVHIENDLSDDEIVGTTIKQHLENTPYVHEEDLDMNPSTTAAKDEERKSSNDMEITSREDDELSDNIASSSSVGLSNSENAVNTHAGEPGIQKEDPEKRNFVNGDMEITSWEDDELSDNIASSSSVGLSNSENAVNTHAGEPDIRKEDPEKGNLVNGTTLESTVTGITISGPEDDKCTDNSSDIDKEDQEKASMATDIEIRTQEEANSTTKSSSSSPARLSSSENLANGLAHEPDLQKENDEKGNTVNDTTMCNHQCAENIEMKPEDVSHTAFSKKDGECSIFEETQDMKTDLTDNNGTREPNAEANTSAWPRKASVLSKFVKLCAASSIFHNNSNDNDDNKDLSLIKISNDKNQEMKDDQNEIFLESPELKAIKGRIVLYTKLWCQNCKEARIFLRKRRLRYSEINIDMYPSRKVELEEITGSSDVPKVFFNQVLIGGLNELKGFDESGQLEEKIEYVTSEGPSNKAPLPPLSGEDDVSCKGGVDELAVIVRKMKASIVVKDRFYKFRRVTNCFLGSEVVDFLSEDQFLEREGAIEFARKLVKELFFRHVLEENTFEDGDHLYRFLDQEPTICQCQNIPRGIIQSKRQPLVELSHRLRFLLYAILDAYTSEDGKHIAYRTIHGSEEFARYLRIAEELQRLDLNQTIKEEKLAFFINLYNLMTIHAILVWGHPEGALDRRRIFNDFKYVIGGRAYSLSDIYNGILRSNQRPPYSLTKPFGISDKRFKVALPYPEPLIHFALVSGNRSAPALRCYSPKNIDKELMEAARDFLQSGAFELHLDSMTISVTKILSWYSADFGKNEVEILKHAANYLEVEKTQTLLELIDDTQLKVVYQPYDWRLNSRQSQM